MKLRTGFLNPCLSIHNLQIALKLKEQETLVWSTVVTYAYFLSIECVDCCWLRIRLISYAEYIKITVHIKQCLITDNDYSWTLNIIYLLRYFIKLSIKYHSYQKSAKIDAIEQKMYMCHNPRSNAYLHRNTCQDLPGIYSCT